MNAKNQDTYILSSVYNSLQILDLLSEKDNLSIAEISKELGFGRSSVFRMLYTLEKCSYIQKNENAKYSLGYKFASYGSEVIRKQDIVAICRPYMRELRDRFNEAVQLGVLTKSGKVVFIAKEASDMGIQMNTVIWREKEAYSMASGKVMLSQLEPEDMLYYISGYEYVPLTANTVKDKEQLLAQLEIIRKAGYATDMEESELGLVCFAAPIFNCSGKCVASLSISGLSTRMYPLQHELVNAVVETARAISGALGHTRQ